MKLSLLSIFWVAAVLLNCNLWASTKDDCDGLAAPIISSERQFSCVGQPVVLKATNCEGTVVWSNQKMGNILTVYPTKSTIYKAYCKKADCKSHDSNPLTITINIPATPIVKATKTKICLGESVVLSTTGCTGEAIWSNGMTGSEIQVQPIHTTKFTATCRTEGCISCFADDVIITVMGGEPLLLTATKPVMCKGESNSISAKGSCAGQIKWSTGEIGKTIAINPENTTDYWALCETEGCEPIKSTIIVQVTPPPPPQINIDKKTICLGESIHIWTEGCNGVVQWSNGMQGRDLKIQQNESTQFTAVCMRGTCKSNPSLPIGVLVEGKIPSPPQVLSDLKNSCPFVTVDLASSLRQKPSAGIIFEARMGSSPESVLVTDVGAVAESRTYYLFARNTNGCYSTPSLVKVNIAACEKPLPICTNNPAIASIEKTKRTTAGNYYLQGKIGGAASSGNWHTNGTGQFNANSGLSVIYTPSPEDRQAGNVTIQFTSNDPDGEGPCKAGSALAQLKIDAKTDRPKEMIGVNKFVKGWKRIKNDLFEIEYAIQVVNMGTNDLIEVTIKDSLDRVFKNGAVIVGKPIIKAIDLNTGTEVAWGIDTAYTGKGNLNNLLIPESSRLSAGQARSVMVKVKVNFSNAQDSTYYNTAKVSAIDINGNICEDKSTNGSWPDLNQNEDPTDDTAPTPLALSSLRGDEGDVFIPEGFSPNSDGVNDFFVVKKPSNLRASLEVYNRWGGLVYKTEDYKNDWNGGVAAQNNVPAGTYFYEIKLNDGREFSRFLTISR